MYVYIQTLTYIHTNINQFIRNWRELCSGFKNFVYVSRNKLGIQTVNLSICPKKKQIRDTNCKLFYLSFNYVLFCNGVGGDVFIYLIEYYGVT